MGVKEFLKRVYTSGRSSYIGKALPEYVKLCSQSREFLSWVVTVGFLYIVVDLPLYLHMFLCAI